MTTQKTRDEYTDRFWTRTLDTEISTDLDLIDTHDYRDILADLIKPDPDEPTNNLTLFLANH